LKYHVQIGDRQLVLELIPDSAGGPPQVLVEGQEVTADLTPLDGPLASLIVAGDSQLLSVESEPLDGAPGNSNFVVRDALGPLRVMVESDREYSARQMVGRSRQGPSGDSTIRSQMPGVVIDVKVSEGDSVVAGQALVVLEAMKMENDIRTEAAGVVKAVRVSAGQAVKKGEVLVEIKPCQP
jgi:biotin carboxyl carrier protein